MEKKKPFKDTAVGRWLKNNVPDVLDKIDDHVPLVSILTAAVKGKNLTPEQQQEFDKLLMEHEKEMYDLEVKDRETARNREVEMAKTGRTDWMMYFVGVFVLLLSSGVIYAVFYTEMVNSEMSHFIAGEVIGFAASVVMYYYGASYKGQKSAKV